MALLSNALAQRPLILQGTYVFATSIIASLGAITLAASEIMRQVFIISMQSFTALDISSQALVASYLGQVGPSHASILQNCQTRCLQ